MSTPISLTVQGGAFVGAIPTLTYGDLYAFSLTLDAGSIAKDDVLLLAVNDSRIFYSEGMANGDAPVMAAIRHDVTAAEASDHAVTLYLPTRTRVFLERTNGLPKPLDCWIGLYVLRAADSSYATLAEARIKCNPVIADAVRSTAGLDTVHFYTKDEIDAIVASLNAQAVEVETAKTAAQQAQTAAETAQGKAEEAQTKAETAQGKAETAQGKAETVQGKAETAQEKAETAQGKAETAQTKAETAQSKAETAATTAVNAMNAAASFAGAAANAANSAAGSANSAAQFASGAQSSATAAANSAQAAEEAKGAVNTAKTAVNTLAANAEQAATNAASAANAAAGSAQNAQTSAENAETSAMTASQQAQIATEKVGEAVQAAETVKEAAETVATAAEEAQQTLDEFEHRLSASYIYGFDWTDANLLANEAGQCVVLNNLYDNAQYNASLRYMQVQAHGVLPAHNFKRCVCSSARNVAYYTHPSNSRLKADGVTPSVLTGADGDFNVEFDITYYRVDTYTDANSVEHTVWLVSDKPFNGSQPNRYFYVSPDGKTLRKQYVGACRSCVCDADGNTLNNNKTATTDTTYQADKTYYSRLNNVFTALRAGTDYTVGDTITQGSTVDTKIYQKTVVASSTGYANGRKYRSLVGALPAANATRTQFRSGHNNNGYDSVNFLFASYIGMMMAIEFGSFNIQSKFSPGYTNLQTFDYKEMRLTGRTDVFGNNSGEIVADDADADGEDYDLLTMKSGATQWNTAAQNDHSQRIVQCSYRGIEDPFGSQWCNDEGIQKNQDAFDLSITYGGNVYLRDEQDDPEPINLYGWLNGTTKFYTTSAEPEVGLNLYANTGMTTVTGTVVSAEADFSAITVGTKVYTRSAVNDTTGHSYAWKNGADIIYSHVVNPHTDANTREVFSDVQLTQKLGNVTAVEDDYSESGYWCTQATSKYSMLDTDRGRRKGDEYVFPVTGYTGDTIVWVHHEWQKGSWFPSKFDPHTFYGIRRTGNYGSATKGLCDQTYNDTSAGPRLALRFGSTTNGSNAGPFFVSAYNGLTYSTTAIGSRSAA